MHIQPYRRAAGADARGSKVMSAVTKRELNDVIRKLEKVDRASAVELLGFFGVMNTVVLPENMWQPCYDAVEAALAKRGAP